MILRGLVVFILFFWFNPGLTSQTGGVEASYNFHPGETLDFKLSYGWFTVGKAQITIDEKYHSYNNKKCLKVDINGQTAGLVGFFTSVNDRWGAYIESATLKPQHAYRDIQEGKYERIERTYFDFDAKKVTVDRYNPVKDYRRPSRVYDLNENVNDLLSSYLLLRNTNLSSLTKGDSLFVDTFYEDELYHFLFLYAGKETISTEMGKRDAHKIYLIMEENEVFPEKGGIVAWISTDLNQLPLRIEAEMFFGSGYCDLVGYKNLKYGPDFE